MGLQLIVVMETNRNVKSDWIYIRETKKRNIVRKLCGKIDPEKEKEEKWKRGRIILQS